MESALNNVGIKVDADELFRDIAENRLPVWIDELPTADVQEVRHGRWEKWDAYAPSGNYTMFQCSVCASLYYNPTHYCPNCGAKMDEVTE